MKSGPLGLARSALRRMGRACGGGIAMSFAVTLPILFTIVGVVSDYAMMGKIRSELQEAADGAAMAGARATPPAGSPTSRR